MASAGVRPSAIAGSWYPQERERLAELVDAFLHVSPPIENQGRVLGLVSPHAGYRYSGACAGYAYAALGGTTRRRVIVLAPSHHGMFRGASVSHHESYRTPLGDVALDREACEALGRHELVGVWPEADRKEHAIEIQLPFLQRALGEFRLIPLLIGSVEDTEMDALASALAAFVDSETLLVASSDFTHYGEAFGYVPFASSIRENLSSLDQGAIELLVARDVEGLAAYHGRTGITACGISPMLTLLRLLPADARGKLLRYYTSGDLTGEWDHSVSYAAIGFFSPAGGSALSGGSGSSREETPQGRAAAPPREDAAGTPHLAPAEKKFLLQLARRMLSICTTEGRERNPPVEDDELPASGSLASPRGVFVTLWKRGELRGCIGTIEPTMPLHQGVMKYARSAALMDPRFSPLRHDELGKVSLEISVLSPARRIAHPGEIQVGHHGVILEKKGRRAVFLPQVAAEHGWDRETMLDHLAEKAGLARDAWREGAALEVFTAEVFAEGEEGTDLGTERV